jgi:phospholipase/carboxylesterase
MAANLLLRDPDKYVGLIMIGGCFPVADDALPLNRLAGKPVLFCRGRSDAVIPPDKFEQAEAYLTGASGASSSFIEYEGGHELSLTIKSAVHTWLNAEES